MKKKFFYAVTVLMIMSLLCVTAFAAVDALTAYSSGMTADTNGNTGSLSCEAYLNFHGTSAYSDTSCSGGLPYSVYAAVFAWDSNGKEVGYYATFNQNYDLNGDRIGNNSYTTAATSITTQSTAVRCSSSNSVTEYGGQNNPSGDYFWHATLSDETA